ncbi:hypothetical protein JTB14_023326 [Gonioctena quinquepunctata]|nr:hypothetical protein JTB14_023326 [Gonioctena quinquepunctata]
MFKRPLIFFIFTSPLKHKASRKFMSLFPPTHSLHTTSGNRAGTASVHRKHVFAPPPSLKRRLYSFLLLFSCYARRPLRESSRLFRLAGRSAEVIFRKLGEWLRIFSVSAIRMCETRQIAFGTRAFHRCSHGDWAEINVPLKLKSLARQNDVWAGQIAS